ncbi:MAG: phosphatidylinositol mannoside acyltransferase [Acidimicrobiia bacterium]|nr:MAG: phosphatidylinositol mannoside acyltransferase [Acidimicrobiia bacterium]
MRGLSGYLLYRFLAGVFARFPPAMARRAGREVGRLLSHVATKRMGLARRHMRRVLGSEPSENEITKAAREMFASYGRYWAEVFWFRASRTDWILEHVDVEGESPVLAARDAGRGVIFAVAHVGNWEVAAPFSKTLGLPIMSVAEELPNQRITEWFIQTRADYGIEVFIVGRGSPMTSLARGLKEGKVAALVADRDLTGTGVEVEFFGERTTMPVGPVALAELTGAAIFPVGTYFDGDRYRLVAYPEIEPVDHENRDVRFALRTQALATAFERIIGEAPTQWHLFQPNWPSDLVWLEQRQ